MAKSQTTQSESSQAQQELPFGRLTDLWGRALDDQLERMDTLFGTWTRYEGRGVKQATEGLDQLGRLATDAVLFAGELSAEWRKLTLDAMRRTATLMTPPRASA